MTTTMRTRMRVLAVASLVGAASFVGCHGFLDVQNPGPIQDTELFTPDAVPALVVGMSADLSDILSFVVRIDAIASDELGHGGSYTPEGLWVRGIIRPEDVNDLWARMQRIRYEAESGVERMKNIKAYAYDTDANAARANLLGGFANRLLGESVCQAVINDGPVQSDSVYFQRAAAEFTEAIRIAGAAKNATDILAAAYGGRASVRAWLGDWSNAVLDAQQVPASFVYNAIFSTNSTRENNSLVQETYVRREFSLYNTSWAQVFKDPRVVWDTIKTNTGAIQTGQDGKTPYFRQAKYTSLGSAIPLVKGTEMLVLQAEAALRGSNIPTAFNFINQERAQYKMSALTAPADLPTAWKTLEFERGAVTWLEARRLWDLRRWYADQGPAHNAFLDGRDKSIPISQAEYQTNANLAGLLPRECQ
jgi:starch-binding outer membrane protein, SusD/RagB family